MDVTGKVGRGRDRTTWIECVTRDMKDMLLKAEDAKERLTLEKKICQ